MAEQLNAVLEAYNIYDKYQSGFRKKHSTETALHRVSNDILLIDCSVLVLYDGSVFRCL